MAWAENSLLLRMIGGPALEEPWLEAFGLGSKMPEDKTGLPPLNEVIEKWKAIHERAITHLQAQTSEDLDEENKAGFAFGGDKSKRMIVHHVIRHEAQHTGHLSWLAKLFGVATV